MQVAEALPLPLRNDLTAIDRTTENYYINMILLGCDRIRAVRLLDAGTRFEGAFGEIYRLVAT